MKNKLYDNILNVVCSIGLVSAGIRAIMTNVDNLTIPLVVCTVYAIVGGIITFNRVLH